MQLCYRKIVFLCCFLLPLTCFADAVSETTKTEPIQLIFGFIPISAAVVAAFVTGFLALIGVVAKIYLDRNFQTRVLRLQEAWRNRGDAAKRRFEKSESDAREKFEMRLEKLRTEFEEGEREKRQKFETEESEERRKFERELAASNAETKLQNEKDMYDYVQQEKYKLQWIERVISIVDTATKELTSVMSLLEPIIDAWPEVKTTQMLRQATNLLDVFGDFQNTVKSSSLPEEIKLIAEDRLLARLTETITSLTPLGTLTPTDSQKKLLKQYKKELQDLVKVFLSACNECQKNPVSYVKKN